MAFNNPTFWKDFEQYLLTKMRKDTANYQLSCSKKYWSVLADENANPLLALSSDKKVHVMKSLSSLSKYLGIYDHWQKIRENYQLKWSEQNNLEIFKKITDNNYSFNSMIKWISETCKTIPLEHANAIIFCTLTGLRAEECFQSIRLFNSNEKAKYLNKNNMTLEHFRYPNIFLRRTKNAYITIVNSEILELIRYNMKMPNYKSLNKILKKNNLSINLSYCRKVFATFLRNNGSEQEIIDLLQGRIPKSIFVKHYYRPDLERLNKIRGLLDNLYKQIIL
jgi:intergrase/recombinase